jgi:hypothetical protein
LHSCLQHRSCDAEEFLRSESKTGTSADRGSELLCGGNALLDATTSFRDYFRVADYPVIGSVSATAFIVTYFFPLDLPACTIAE